MENLFQLLSKKQETLPSDAVKLLSWRQRIKKLTWVGENSVVPRYAKQERDERSIPTPLKTSQQFYSFRSSVTPTFFYMNHFLYVISLPKLMK